VVRRGKGSDGRRRVPGAGGGAAGGDKGAQDTVNAGPPIRAPSGRPWSSGSRSASTASARVPRRVFQRLLPERPTPERCVEAYYLQRTRFESIAERKLRRRQLTEDGNVEISGRDLRKAPGGNCADRRGASHIDP
jgi:hypothetical protein